MATLHDHNYFDLGTFTRPVSTKNPEAQRWFDRGLVWHYGFNQKESAICFEKCIKADPDCVMGYWGLAHARGPNYNGSWGMFDPQELKATLQTTYMVSRQGLEHLRNATPVERALIKAVAKRYPQPVPAGDFTPWNIAYMEAMAEVFKEFGDDLDVAALYAESLMNLTPWALWDPYSGKPGPGSQALLAQSTLEHAFRLPHSDEHPGLLHFHIHLMEMSPVPEVAMPSAEKLRHLVPGSGHLAHMPSHLDVLVGDYRNAITANTAAIIADNHYLDQIGSRTFYSGYRMHNYHSLIYAAMLSGQSQIALENCHKMEASVPEDYVATMPDFLEAFYAVRAHVLVRFGRWDEIIALPLPRDASLYCVTTATLHYAKGVAFAAMGKVPQAEQEQRLFASAQQKVPDSRMDFPNKSVNVLKVAEAMLAGELEYRKGNYDVAFAHLRRSIEFDDNLVYSEPWGWMMPTRHAYAALLMERGHFETALQAYAEDLGFVNTIPRGHQHPNNIWALHGYQECLKSLGRHSESAIFDLPLQLATSLADVKIRSSCFCRKTEGSVRRSIPQVKI